MKQLYDRAGPEPRIDEMLADPIVRLTMQRDGLTDLDVLSAVAEARSRLNAPRLILCDEEDDDDAWPVVWRCPSDALQCAC